MAIKKKRKLEIEITEHYMDIDSCSFLFWILPSAGGFFAFVSACMCSFLNIILDLLIAKMINFLLFLFQ